MTFTRDYLNETLIGTRYETLLLDDTPDKAMLLLHIDRLELLDRGVGWSDTVKLATEVLERYEKQKESWWAPVRQDVAGYFQLPMILGVAFGTLNLFGVRFRDWLVNQALQRLVQSSAESQADAQSQPQSVKAP